VTIPIITATINFSTGPSFANPLTLGTGHLGIEGLSDGTTISVDISNLVNSIEITRGRNITADSFQAGTLSLRLLDTLGNFNPMNVSGPYYGLLNPMRKISISASFANVSYNLFSGYITQFSTAVPNTVGDLAFTTINATDAFQLINLASVTTVAGTSAGETTGSRIGKILDAISWPTSMRNISTGLTTVQADTVRTSPQSALSAIQTIEASEFGSSYIDGAGNFVFKDRSITASSFGGTATVFSDDGSGISYGDAVWILNSQLIYNSASVTRAGGVAQSASDAASIDLYFQHAVNFTGLMMQTDEEALQFARQYVASRKDTSIRCDSLVLDLYSSDYDAGITAALALDFYSPIKITTTQPGSTSVSKTEQVFGVQHSITPNSWRTTFTTLEPTLDAFILGSDVSAILGTSVLSY
jgi:hypothetical protein